MTDRVLEAVREWQLFAKTLKVQHSGRTISWKDYIARQGYTDEERLIQPVVFPEFARLLLDFTVGLNLAPEESGQEGKPDFTPGDSVTHPFVFETKSTAEGASLEGHSLQVKRYLAVGYPRIRKVVLTNLVGIRVFRLDNNADLIEEYSIDLRLLHAGPESEVAATGTARRFADFLDEFCRKELSPAEKLQRVREAPEWNPVVESTSSTWLLGRLDTVVRLLTADVQAQVHDGVLTNPAVMGASERNSIRDELRLLASRLGLDNADELDIQEFLRTSESTPAGKARIQFCAHVAYYAATRLMLVRVWEDLGLLQSMLHDGGFDHQMKRFDDVISDVVDFSFNRARTRYRSLFDQRNNYTWYQPTEATYIDTIYELANTYLGSVESDVLGQVYERMLERIDRKLLGQYYTPRDIIALIWDLINPDEIARQAEEAGRAARILDIAAGSGGFLVDFSARMRRRLDAQQSAGAAISTQEWINGIAEGANGVEIQRFSAYLAELNLL